MDKDVIYFMIGNEFLIVLDVLLDVGCSRTDIERLKLNLYRSFVKKGSE